MPDLNVILLSDIIHNIYDVIFSVICRLLSNLVFIFIKVKVFGSKIFTVHLATIGNLRTTTKFTTTTSVDWEKTGTRTSVSAGKRKLKMQSIGRSTTTTLNVNKHVDCDVRSQQSFFAKASFKTMQDLIL